MIDLIAIDTNDGPIFVTRTAAHAIASGGKLDLMGEHVIGGNPDSTDLPQNAREPTDIETAHVLNRLRTLHRGMRKAMS